MLKNYQFWILTVVGALSIVTAAANMYLSRTNGATQAEANSRAQEIQQGIAMENLYRDIVQALADRAVKTRDEQIQALLSAEGFNINFSPAPGSPPTGDAKQ